MYRGCGQEFLAKKLGTVMDRGTAENAAARRATMKEV